MSTERHFRASETFLQTDLYHLLTCISAASFFDVIQSFQPNRDGCETVLFALLINIT